MAVQDQENFRICFEFLCLSSETSLLKRLAQYIQEKGFLNSCTLQVGVTIRYLPGTQSVCTTAYLDSCSVSNFLGSVEQHPEMKDAGCTSDGVG